MRDLELETRVYSATTIRAMELECSPVLRTLLPIEERPARVTVVLIGRARYRLDMQRETLLVDFSYLSLAHGASQLRTSTLEDLDLPRQALLARIGGWPDTWDTLSVEARQPRQVNGVWEFASERQSEGYPRP